MTTSEAGTPAIEVRGMVKHYGETKALDGVDLTVQEGTVRGVLGPNGAGKTTLVRVLSTLIKPDAGTARVGGWDIQRQQRQLRRTIGRLLDLSAKGAKARAEELLERFSLTEAAKRPAKTYSGGMRRRLDLAASMIGQPRVLFLDEPTTGLDPRTRTEVWEEVQRMVAEGTTVLLTTQYMEEAEQLAQQITVMDRGRIIADGSVSELKQQVGGQTLTVRPTRPEQVEAMVDCLAAHGATTGADHTVTLPVLDERQLTAVIAALAAGGFGIAAIETRMPTLDEVFLTLTAKPGTGATAGSAQSMEKTNELETVA